MWSISSVYKGCESLIMKWCFYIIYVLSHLYIGCRFSFCYVGIFVMFLFPVWNECCLFLSLYVCDWQLIKSSWFSFQYNYFLMGRMALHTTLCEKHYLYVQVPRYFCRCWCFYWWWLRRFHQRQTPCRS